MNGRVQDGAVHVDVILMMCAWVLKVVEPIGGVLFKDT